MLSNRTADLVTALDDAKTPGDLWSNVADYLEKVGITHSIYTVVEPGNPGAARAWTSLPDAWRDHYLDEKYHQFDPFYRYCCNSFSPVGTGGDYIDDHDFLSVPERRLILEGSETGFRTGFSSPVRLRGTGAFGGWNFGSSLPRREFERLIEERGHDLRLAGFYIHEYAEKLAQAEAARRPRCVQLSHRERECLSWLSRGLRTAAIADRLGIAQVTVDMHFKNARLKLSAATREEALAKAILDNLIQP